MTIHRDRFLELVRQPPQEKEARNLAARFEMIEYKAEDSSRIEEYDLSQDDFRFMFADGVEPTNNHSEQPIRHCVIDRKITQGTRSEAGQRNHERMWTAIATCKKTTPQHLRVPPNLNHRPPDPTETADSPPQLKTVNGYAQTEVSV